MRSGRVIRPDQIESLRLEPGSHDSPRDGVCVVELASVLAGEDFSDRPDCVCEVIAAYLRSWNDRAGYLDRQRLRPYANRVIGSRGDRATTARRRDICLVWAELTELRGGPIGRFLGRQRARVKIGWLLGVSSAMRLNEGAPEYAARACFVGHGDQAAFRLLDRLLEVGPQRDDEPAMVRVNGNGNGNGNGHRHRREGLAFVKAVLRARATRARERARR